VGVGPQRPGSGLSFFESGRYLCEYRNEYDVVYNVEVTPMEVLEDGVIARDIGASEDDLQDSPVSCYLAEDPSFFDEGHYLCHSKYDEEGTFDFAFEALPIVEENVIAEDRCTEAQLELISARERRGALPQAWLRRRLAKVNPRFLEEIYPTLPATKRDLKRLECEREGAEQNTPSTMLHLSCPTTWLEAARLLTALAFWSRWALFPDSLHVTLVDETLSLGAALEDARAFGLRCHAQCDSERIDFFRQGWLQECCAGSGLPDPRDLLGCFLPDSAHSSDNEACCLCSVRRAGGCLKRQLLWCRSFSDGVPVAGASEVAMSSARPHTHVLESDVGVEVDECVEGAQTSCAVTVDCHKVGVNGTGDCEAGDLFQGDAESETNCGDNAPDLLSEPSNCGDHTAEDNQIEDNCDDHDEDVHGETGSQDQHFAVSSHHETTSFDRHVPAHRHIEKSTCGDHVATALTVKANVSEPHAPADRHIHNSTCGDHVATALTVKANVCEPHAPERHIQNSRCRDFVAPALENEVSHSDHVPADRHVERSSCGDSVAAALQNEAIRSDRHVLADVHIQKRSLGDHVAASLPLRASSCERLHLAAKSCDRRRILESSYGGRTPAPPYNRAHHCERSPASRHFENKSIGGSEQAALHREASGDEGYRNCQIEKNGFGNRVPVATHKKAKRCHRQKTAASRIESNCCEEHLRPVPHNEGTRSDRHDPWGRHIRKSSRGEEVPAALPVKESVCEPHVPADRLSQNNNCDANAAAALPVKATVCERRVPGDHHRKASCRKDRVSDLPNEVKRPLHISDTPEPPYHQVRGNSGSAGQCSCGVPTQLEADDSEHTALLNLDECIRRLQTELDRTRRAKDTKPLWRRPANTERCLPHQEESARTHSAPKDAEKLNPATDTGQERWRTIHGVIQVFTHWHGLSCFQFSQRHRQKTVHVKR